MKKIYPKIKAQEWSQHSPILTHGYFFKRPGVANSLVHGSILPNHEPIRDFLVVLVIRKNKKEPIKMKKLEWSQDCLHYNPMGAICCHGNQSSDPI